MNRKKKINEALKKAHKKKMSKLHKSNKPKYISKAEREKMATEAASADSSVADNAEASVTVVDAE